MTIHDIWILWYHELRNWNQSWFDWATALTPGIPHNGAAKMPQLEMVDRMVPWHCSGASRKTTSRIKHMIEKRKLMMAKISKLQLLLAFHSHLESSLSAIPRSFGFRHPRIEMGALRPWQHVGSTQWQCGKMGSKDQQLEMQGSIQRMIGWTELEIHIKWNRYVEHAQGFTFLCLLCGTVFMQSKLCYAKRVHARRLLTWDLY